MVFTKLLDFDFENTVGITKTVSADVNNTVRLITKIFLLLRAHQGLQQNSSILKLRTHTHTHTIRFKKN